MKKVELAKVVANFMHSNQTYGDGKPYTTHLQSVVDVLKEFKITDEDLLVTAWLHDILEDTYANPALIETYFGERIMQLVFAVTNERGINRKERNVKTYKKLLNHPEAIKVKLADRISNVRNSIVNANTTRFYEMYKNEYESFREVLYKPNEFVEMWETLDRLLDYKSKPI